VTDQDAVLAANAAFYVAFARGDFAAMQALWAQDAPVACVHPGWPPLQDRAKIMQSWQGILANPPRPPIVALEPQVQLHGETALVICWEAIGAMHLVATNVFVRERGAWRMVMHQSGQTAHVPKGATPPPSSPQPTVH
jgi:ketosteroid isomerase-like protein